MMLRDARRAEAHIYSSDDASSRQEPLPAGTHEAFCICTGALNYAQSVGAVIHYTQFVGAIIHYAPLKEPSMSMMSISQSAMLTDAVHAAHHAPRSRMSFQSQSSRFASEPMSSERAMCTMHMADKAMYAAMAMSMVAAASASTLIIKTDVYTSVSLFAGLSSVVFIALVVLLVVSLLLGSLVVLISLITLLLTCLTRQKTLESLVGLIKRTVELASIRINSIQGA